MFRKAYTAAGVGFVGALGVELAEPHWASGTVREERRRAAF